MRFTARWQAILVGSLLALPFTTVAAQDVRGVVRDSASGIGVSGAVVMLLDSADSVLVRSISNQRGEYRIPLTPAAKRIRTLRLGFRPRVATLPAAVDGNIAALDIRLVAIPIHLETVRTLAARSCPKRADGPAALAILDQARSGLLATIVARAANPPAVKRLKFERRMEGNTDRIGRQVVHIDSIEATVPFAAAHNALTFIDRGFMEDSAGMQVFYAPDAEVLVDDGFSNGYCFRVMKPEFRRPNQIGVGFSAADTRPGRVDIDGAMWIDTARKALVDIDFAFKGLGAQVEEYRPGGHIEFREMPNGVVFVDRWHLRLVGAEPRPRPPAAPGRRMDIAIPAIYAHEVGGEIADARWPDGTSWHAQLGTLRVHAFRRDSIPVAGTFVELDSTDYRAIVDSAGRFEIHDLLPGPYKAVVVDDELAPLGVTIPTDLAFEAERDSTYRLQLEVKSASTWVRETCVSEKFVMGNAWLMARIYLPNGKPADSADWSILTLVDSAWTPTVRGRVAADGMLHVCNLKSELETKIVAKRGDASVEGALTALHPGFNLVSIVLRLPAVAKP